MGDNLCCHDANKNNQSITVYAYYLIEINHIILQLSYNLDNNKKRSSISSCDIKNKRTSSIETYFNSQNLNDIPRRNQLLKAFDANKDNFQNSSKSSVKENLKTLKTKSKVSK